MRLFRIVQHEIGRVLRAVLELPNRRSLFDLLGSQPLESSDTSLLQLSPDGQHRRVDILLDCHGQAGHVRPAWPDLQCDFPLPLHSSDSLQCLRCLLQTLKSSRTCQSVLRLVHKERQCGGRQEETPKSQGRDGEQDTESKGQGPGGLQKLRPQGTYLIN